MAKIVKKKKRKLGARGAGASGREQSPLRPLWQPKMAPCGGEGCPNHNPIRAVLRIINNYDFNRNVFIVTPICQERTSYLTH